MNRSSASGSSARRPTQKVCFPCTTATMLTMSLSPTTAQATASAASCLPDRARQGAAGANPRDWSAIHVDSRLSRPSLQPIRSGVRSTRPGSGLQPAETTPPPERRNTGQAIQLIAPQHLVERFGREYPSLLERLVREERRRVNAAGTSFGTQAHDASVVRASDRWGGITVGEFERRQLERLRDQLVKDHRRRNAPAVTVVDTPSHVSSKNRTGPDGPVRSLPEGLTPGNAAGGKCYSPPLS